MKYYQHHCHGICLQFFHTALNKFIVKLGRSDLITDQIQIKVLTTFSISFSSKFEFSMVHIQSLNYTTRKELKFRCKFCTSKKLLGKEIGTQWFDYIANIFFLFFCSWLITFRTFRTEIKKASLANMVDINISYHHTKVEAIFFIWCKVNHFNLKKKSTERQGSKTVRPTHSY